MEVPLSALSRFEVLATTYAAEFGRSPNGVVNIETRAGGERWSGEAFVYNRPGIPFDARPPIVPAGENADDFRRAQEGFRRTQVGGGLGGPLAARTHLRLRRGRVHQRERGPHQLDGARHLHRPRGARHVEGRAAAGPRLEPDQTTTLRLAVSHAARAGEGSGIVAPEADITTVRAGAILADAPQRLAQGRASNTSSHPARHLPVELPADRSDLLAPQVTILDRDSIPVGVVGSSNFVFDERSAVPVTDVFEAQLGTRHTLRAGADVVASAFELTGSSTESRRRLRGGERGQHPDA